MLKRHPLITIVVAQLFGTSLWSTQGLMVIWWLLPGPLLGLLAMRRLTPRA